ncbi:MAG: hypothetical protein IJ282_09140 [Lachnospiraceae bacterium]|nr:hypothetical protein [Lachnospiraceae bacterium]
MNELEKQVEYRLSEVIKIFSNRIIENGVDNFLDDVDFCIYTTDFVDVASGDTICYLDDYPEVDENDEEIYTDFVTERKLVMFYSGEQFEDVIGHMLSQKMDASIEDFIAGINYYREHDDFLDL